MTNDPDGPTGVPAPEREASDLHAETAVSTGVDLLDEMLGGGLPRNRSTLFVGGPGTGKSTLAMSFLQAGLDRGERCLYVSTEQTISELRGSFAPYEFDLDDENLTYTSVHARPGSTIEEGETVVLQSLSGDDGIGDDFGAPFETRYVRKHLERFAPCDRIVFDSVSGLASVAEDPQLFRRNVLDLIRLFADEFGATTVFTAEDRDDDAAPVSPLRFTTHGVVRLERRDVAADPHRFLTIEKMRGVDHDRRTVEFEFDTSGIVGAPKRRSQPPALKQHRHSPVGIDGLDELTGGGPVQGSGVLLEHDGQVTLSVLLANFVVAALDRGEAVTLVPSTDLGRDRLAALLDGFDYDLGSLLDDDRLFVLDPVSGWDAATDNVLTVGDSLGSVTDALETVDFRRDADARFTLVDVPSLVHHIGHDAVRELRYHLDANLSDTDSLVHLLNPDVVGDRTAAFHLDAADQVLRSWLTDDGLQYVSLEKSPCGFVGSTSLVEFLEDPPYVDVQSPPRSRETPMSGPVAEE